MLFLEVLQSFLWRCEPKIRSESFAVMPDNGCSSNLICGVQHQRILFKCSRKPKRKSGDLIWFFNGHYSAQESLADPIKGT